MKIILFDIDGTMLSTKGAGSRAMEAALIKHFGTAGSPGYSYGGRTDGQIARDLMRGVGFSDATIDARMGAVLADYVAGLHKEIAAAPHAVNVYTGVVRLLETLGRRSDAVVGLLTGNIEPGAHAKLTAAGIGMTPFRVGAFGSDHEHRDALPAIAQARAAALLGRDVAGDALVIIGDTPHDITCGRAIRARAIAVATGSYGASALAEHSPAALFDDLSETSRVVDAIFAT